MSSVTKPVVENLNWGELLAHLVKGGPSVSVENIIVLDCIVLLSR